ncbi:hypothetical protein L195_g001631 [Trifolium pratense]|uniref:Putative plant transposon protein domain-containing protein n=1 Tax=Trifolium pratense TaxID=57577 RepID=A0A2K3NQ88_TRIPR|nr:hypothetical protein L195_g001631 [Trifolium pratense]
MSSRITRLLGKGKKSDNTDPPQQPPKKKKLSKGVGSQSGHGGSSHAPPPAPVFNIGSSDTPRPSLLQPFSDKFFCEERMARYVKIREFGFNREKAFDYDLLNGVPEIHEHLIARKWEKLNHICQKKKDSGNATLVREFYANASKSLGAGSNFVVYVRGNEVDYSPEALNSFLGVAGVPEGAFKIEKKAVKVADEPGRRVVRDFVALPGTPWYKGAPTTLPTKIQLRNFKPVARAWAEFFVRNIVSISNSSKYQIENAAAVKVIMEGRPLNLGYWLCYSIRSIATNAANTFTLGHCNLITALCRARHVPETKYQDEGQLPVKALSLKVFQGFGAPQGPRAGASSGKGRS